MTTATHTTENLKPILDKIARLKNLAAQPGTPEEAAAAQPQRGAGGDGRPR